VNLWSFVPTFRFVMGSIILALICAVVALGRSLNIVYHHPFKAMQLSFPAFNRQEVLWVMRCMWSQLDAIWAAALCLQYDIKPSSLV
jgi:hypothetical protein